MSSCPIRRGRRGPRCGSPPADPRPGHPALARSGQMPACLPRRRPPRICPAGCVHCSSHARTAQGSAARSCAASEPCGGRCPATPGVRAGGTDGDNAGMRLDHVSYAAGPGGLKSTAAALGALLGEEFHDGGIHPRFGTRNMVLPLAAGTYLEVVDVLDHPASDKAPFGQAVRARSALGGGWLGWVVAVDDIAKVEERLGRRVGGRQPAPARRRRAALAADRRQGPPVRPAAAVLRRVGVPEGAASQRRQHRRRLARHDRDRRRPAPGQRVARQLCHRTARGRGGRVGLSGGRPRGSSRRASTPRTAQCASSATTVRSGPLASRMPNVSKPLAGSVPSPNIWQHTETYELENRRRRPRRPHRGRDPRHARRCRLDRPRRARPRLRHRLPPAPLGGRRTVGPWRGAASRPRGGCRPSHQEAGQRHGARRHGAGGPPGRGNGRRHAGSLGVLLRTRAASRDSVSWTG